MASKKVERQELDIRAAIGQAALSELEGHIIDVLSGKGGRVGHEPQSAGAFRNYLRGDTDFEALLSIVTHDLYGDPTARDIVEPTLKGVLERLEDDDSILYEDCPICARDDVRLIDKDLIVNAEEGNRYWQVSRRYHVSDHALVAHHREHLIPELLSYVDSRRKAAMPV
jgi:hypothetical protein